MTWPSSIATTRFEKAFTSSFSCVTTRTVVPSSFIFSSRSISSRLRTGSRLPVGSSAIIMRGLFTRARAMATRCCSPPDSSSG